MSLKVSTHQQSVVHSDGIARRIVLEKASNFRDLGGFQTPFGTTRFGSLYRSDQLGLLGSEDIALLTGDLGIVQVLDLRGYDEVEIAGKGPLAEESSVAYHNIPVSERALFNLKPQNDKKSRDITVSYRYFQRLMSDASNFKKILTHLTAHLEDSTKDSESNRPTVFNCVAGRDRTGLLAMLILGAAGVSAHDIADDYAATVRVPKEELGRSMDPKLMEFWKDYVKSINTTHLENPEAMYDAMSELLELINEDYGTSTTSKAGNGTVSGIEGYLDFLGVPVEKVRRLLV